MDDPSPGLKQTWIQRVNDDPRNLGTVRQIGDLETSARCPRVLGLATCSVPQPRTICYQPNLTVLLKSLCSVY